MPAGLALVDEGSVRVAPLLVLPQLLAERGLDPGRVIGECGIELSCFEDPDNRISFPALGRLLAHAVTATGCPHLGLEIGRRNGLDVLGAIGEMARVAPYLGSALRAIILEAFEALAGMTFAEKVRRLLRQLLIASPGPDDVGLEQVARLFAMHRRTLNRRLRDQGTSFRALLGQTRYEIACQLLRDTRLASRDVAGALGYADVTAFSRAFRCWSGTTPAAWRSTHQPD